MPEKSHADYVLERFRKSSKEIQEGIVLKLAQAAAARTEDGNQIGQENKYGEVMIENGVLHEGEPVFLLRGTDPLTPVAILEYAKRCEESGCNTDHVESCRKRAEEITDWQRRNFELVKSLPD